MIYNSSDSHILLKPFNVVLPPFSIPNIPTSYVCNPINKAGDGALLPAFTAPAATATATAATATSASTATATAASTATASTATATTAQRGESSEKEHYVNIDTQHLGEATVLKEGAYEEEEENGHHNGECTITATLILTVDTTKKGAPKHR